MCYSNRFSVWSLNLIPFGVHDLEKRQCYKYGVRQNFKMSKAAKYQEHHKFQKNNILL